MDTPDKVKSITEDTSTLLLNPRFLGPCLAGIFCLIVATVVGIAYLFTMATVLLALPIASYIIGALIHKKCTVEREARITTTQGERTCATIRVKTPEGYMLRELSARDRLPDTIKAENSDDRILLTDTTSDLQIWFTPQKRGSYTIGPLELSASDPLGMFHIRRKIGEFTELVVYPKPVKFKLYSFSHGYKESDSVITTGRKAPRGDFAGVREYRLGDELRRIHWKTTARTQELTVVEYEDVTGGCINVLLDLYRGTDFGTGLITSLDIAAGAAAYAVRSYLSMGRIVKLLLPVGASLDVHNVSSLKDLPSALFALAGARSEALIKINDAVKMPSIQGNLLIISANPNEQFCSAVREHHHKGNEVSVVVVDPTPFGWTGDLQAAAVELRKAGAIVEIIRRADQN